MDRVALFVTCLVDQFFPEVGEASVRLLESAGCRVEFPEAQTCCGQPAMNSGYPDEAREIGRRLVDIFDGYDAVVAPSGSCASMARVHLPELLRGDSRRGGTDLHVRAEALASRTFELTEFLAARDFDPSASTFEGRVAYHGSCHLLRDLGVRSAPRDLLAKVPGVELVEMEESEVCCGFGGTFSVKMADLSVAMLGDKLGAAEASGADVLTATDCGCLMHLGGALHRRGSALRALHVARILAG